LAYIRYQILTLVQASAWTSVTEYLLNLKVKSICHEPEIQVF
jgi:hypothetical protein